MLLLQAEIKNNFIKDLMYKIKTITYFRKVTHQIVNYGSIKATLENHFDGKVTFHALDFNF